MRCYRSELFKTLCVVIVLIASICLASDKAVKKRIAVFDFEDKTAHRHRWWTGQAVGEGMADMLVTELVKSGKYQVIERQELQSIMKEQQLGASGAITPQSAAEMGKLLGVELAIYGSVNEFGFSKSDIGGRLKKKAFGLGVQKQNVTVAIDVRFVNTSTGEILVSENVRREKSKTGLSVSTKIFDFKNRQQFDSSLIGKATREAINDIVDMVDDKSDAIKWEAKIVKGDGPIFINAGAVAGVNVGDQYVVYRPGEELIDPDTGLSLGAVEQKVGVIEIIDNSIGDGKASKCKAVSGSDFKRNDVVREK